MYVEVELSCGVGPLHADVAWEESVAKVELGGSIAYGYADAGVPEVGEDKAWTYVRDLDVTD